MRVLVVTSGALFVRGGHLVIAEETVSALIRCGHEAELLVTPQNRFGRQASAYLATWLTDVGMTADGRPVDRVVSFRFPSYAVRHRQHVCWLNHRMREYYDLWNHFVRGLGRRGRLKEAVRRRLFHAADRWLLTRNVTRLLAQSRVVQQRLRRFGGIESEVLLPPPPELPYRTDGYDETIFAVSRLDRLKRIDLLVEAVGHAPRGTLRARIAGEGPELDWLRKRVRALGIERQIEFLGRIGDEQLVDELARCRAVFFAPRDEDYGLVTLQAFRAGKAVVTGTDSGGPTELVRHGENGLIAAPTSEAMAEALMELTMDKARAERLGAQAREDSREHTWERCVGELTR